MRHASALALACALLLPWAAEAAPEGKVAGLDLRLQRQDLAPQLEQRRPGRGYVARVEDDPWRQALADGAAQRVGGPAIPRMGGVQQRDEDGEVVADEPSLRGLLEGEIFPILRIRLSPAPAS